MLGSIFGCNVWTDCEKVSVIHYRLVIHMCGSSSAFYAPVFNFQGRALGLFQDKR